MTKLVNNMDLYKKFDELLINNNNKHIELMSNLSVPFCWSYIAVLVSGGVILRDDRLVWMKKLKILKEYVIVYLS